DPITNWGPKNPPFPEEAGPYSDSKDPKTKIPAIDRYWSERLWAVEEIAKEDGEQLEIISGLYGLVASGDSISWYDQFLTPDKARELLPKILTQLKEKSPSSVVYWYGNKELSAIK